MTQFLPQAVGVIVVIVLLVFGRKKLLPHAQGSRVLLWLTWLVTVLCGLVLGWALYGLVGWLTSVGGVGGVIGSIGGLVALAMGWHGMWSLVACIRDVADGQPDDDARKAALWVPTTLPAGWHAVMGIVMHPRSLSSGITDVIMVVITMVGTHLVVKAALKANKGRTAWMWFAAAVCLLAGIVATPLVLYLDGLLAQYLPHTWLISARVIAGAFGFALLLAAIKDITDKVPDQYVRTFLRAGLPLLITCGAVTFTTIAGHATDGAQILTGSM